MGLSKSDINKLKANKDIEGLIKALKDKDSSIRYKVASALSEIGDIRAVKPLIKALGDEDIYVRRNAAEALGNIGKPAVEPLSKAYEALNDKDKNYYTVLALINIEEAIKKIKAS